MCALHNSVLDLLFGCAAQTPPPPSTPPAPPALSGTSAPSAPSTPPAAPAAPAALKDVPAHRVSLTPRFLPGVLMVRFTPGTTAQQQAHVLAEARVTIGHRIAQLGVVVVNVVADRRDAVQAKLRASRFVARIEKDAVVEKLDTTPNDTYWAAQWGLGRIGLPTAWDQTRGAAGLVVAVLDTGVDASHPDLAGAVLSGFNVIANNTDSSDLEGHGTAVAGVIAARSNNTAGVAGICWTCSILPVKVLGDDGTGDMATLATGIVRAAAAGARVINMSLGGPVGSATLDQAIAYAVEKNAVLVAAAGNNGVETPFYPAANPNVISVAATDENDQLYSWSNRGTWVNVTAPGCDPATAPGALYINFCGTSAAAPVVAGLAALTVSVLPTAARAAVMRAITASTDPLQSLPGRINAPKSLTTIAPRKWSLRGSVGTSPASRTHKRVVAAGNVNATLTFNHGARATLTVADPRGRVLATKTGASPLKVTKRLGAGTYSFSVRRKTSSKISYTLAVVSGP